MLVLLAELDIEPVLEVELGVDETTGFDVLVDEDAAEVLPELEAGLLSDIEPGAVEDETDGSLLDIESDVGVDETDGLLDVEDDAAIDVAVELLVLLFAGLLSPPATDVPSLLTSEALSGRLSIPLIGFSLLPHAVSDKTIAAQTAAAKKLFFILVVPFDLFRGNPHTNTIIYIYIYCQGVLGRFVKNDEEILQQKGKAATLP